MAKRNIFRGLAAVLALGMCMTGLAGCGSEKRADGKQKLKWFPTNQKQLRHLKKLKSGSMKHMMTFI